MSVNKNHIVILLVLVLSCQLVQGHYTFPLPNVIMTTERSIIIDNIKRRRESSTPRPSKQVETKKNINRRGSIGTDESDTYSAVENVNSRLGPWGVSISTGT